MKYIYCCCFCWLLIACQQEAQMGTGQFYFPTPATLKKGIANKYYLHYKRIDSNDTNTNVVYQLYQSSNKDQLVVSDYDAGFELKFVDTYQFEESKILLAKQQRFIRGDTLEVSIGRATFMDWQQDTATYQRTVQFDWGKQVWKYQQISIKDTLVFTKPAKIITSSSVLTVLPEEEESKEYTFQYRKIYVSGIGLFQEEQLSEFAHSKKELVAQIPFDNFSKQVAHGVHRVGYIDPTKVLDKEKDFQLCYGHKEINNYYRGVPDAGFTGGKGALKRQLLPKIDTSKLGKESGYLTYRFVVNCQGKIGWFVTEQADLDFQVKAFPSDLVQHIYELIASLDTWHPTIVEGEASDAYVYLTIKLKDGAIIDFLP